MRSSVAVPLCLSVLVAAAAGGAKIYSERPPSPDSAAQALADGLSSLDLSQVPVSELSRTEATRQLAGAAAGMDGLRPQVTVASAEADEDGATATVTLDVVWDVDDSDQDWTYTTTAHMTREDRTWPLQWSPSVLEPSLASGEGLRLQEAEAPRGRILGAGGAVLVTERPVLRIGIDKTEVAPEQVADSARALAALLDIDEAGYAAQVEAAGPQAFVEGLVLRDDGSSEIDADRLGSIPGVAALPDHLPLAPTRTFARPILGTVGEATAELIDASNGALQLGDPTGLSGLQKAKDAPLRGQLGTVVQAVPAEGGDGVRELFRRDPVPGTDVTTTLDPRLQVLAEEILAPVQPASAIVAIQPSTGHVLAAASGPGGQGYSTATQGRYAPGSTFKVVTSLALLGAGLDQDSTVACPTTTVVDGRSFKNYDDYPSGANGDISLRRAIANSCNTALIGQHEQVSQADLVDAAAALGLGVRHEMDGVPSFTGSVPAEAGATEHAASMIGQGRVEASPLAMAAVAASITRGETVLPRLLVDDIPNPAPQTPPPDQAGVAAVRDMMRAVVTEGSARFLADVPGEPIGAKTGTAEHGTDQPPRTHAWMIATQGDLAIAVFVEDGAGGAKTAGPLLEDFLRSLHQQQ